MHKIVNSIAIMILLIIIGSTAIITDNQLIFIKDEEHKLFNFKILKKVKPWGSSIENKQYSRN
jgi:hypothetical protein